MVNGAFILARQEGLEPPTPGLEGPCSIQLSYCRVIRNGPRILARRARKRKNVIYLVLTEPK